MTPATCTIRQHFANLRDPRQPSRRRHPLLDIVLIALCAVIAGANTWPQIETFARKRRDWLRKFCSLPHDIPTHDTFERVFDRLQPRAFQACFRRWVQALASNLGLPHLAIDGKTLCGSHCRSKGLGPLHVVSAWATQAHLSLGQVVVAEKSNEITAIPQLLELLDIQGALITIDAMGCQKEIAAKIVAGGGDYVLAVKENQPNLLEDIQQTFEQALDTNYAGMDYDTYETQEQGHGRSERRSYVVLYALDGIRDRALWDGLTAIGMCVRTRTVKGETSEEAHYFIGSMKSSAASYAAGLRHHWGIENNLHWQLDVSFREDENRVQKRNGAENLTLLRRLALALLKRHPSKPSINLKRYNATLDTQFLEEVLCAGGTLGEL
jgi:predicted transposase YbfD/YdcC